MAAAPSHTNQQNVARCSVDAGEAAPLHISIFFSPYQSQLSQCFKRGGILTWLAAVKLATL